MMNTPKRGEVWLIDLGFVAKTRPCLVLSIPAEDEDRALVTLVPHTTSARGSRFEVGEAVSFLKQGVFDAQNLITIPNAKLIRKLGNLSAEQMEDIEDAVCDWLGL
jgi:mRNA interferase MazF